MFVLVFDNTEESAKKVERNNHAKYFLPRVNIIDYNVLIDRRNFYEQQINDTKKNDTMKSEKLQQDKEMITQ